jgi:hypothetical protein
MPEPGLTPPLCRQRVLLQPLAWLGSARLLPSQSYLRWQQLQELPLLQTQAWLDLRLAAVPSSACWR